MRSIPVTCSASVILLLLSCNTEPPSSSIEEVSALVQPQGWWESLPRPVYATLERVPISQEWFEVYRLTGNTWAFYEPHQFEEAISYLVTGADKAVLIDTGTGIGDLRSAAEELTDLPLSVLNTHTHWDHIGDNSQFSEIACFNHPECIRKLRDGVDRQKLMNAVSEDSVWKPLPPGFDINSWHIPSVAPTSLFQDGDMIELGGRALEVIHTPGHSPGSVCLLDSQNRLLFTGDTFFPGPLYAHPEDVDIQDYVTSIQRLTSRISEYDTVLSGHNDPWVKSEVIPRVAQAFAAIMDGAGKFQEQSGLRRYSFDGFDILIRTDQVRALR